MLTKDELISVVDDALDQARYRLRVSTDEDLAKHLNVSGKTISFWRNGRWTKADEALVGVLVHALCNQAVNTAA